jgi:hypothetical protein
MARFYGRRYVILSLIALPIRFGSNVCVCFFFLSFNSFNLSTLSALTYDGASIVID